MKTLKTIFMFILTYGCLIGLSVGANHLLKSMWFVYNAAHVLCILVIMVIFGISFYCTIEYDSLLNKKTKEE